MVERHHCDSLKSTSELCLYSHTLQPVLFMQKFFLQKFFLQKFFCRNSYAEILMQKFLCRQEQVLAGLRSFPGMIGLPGEKGSPGISGSHHSHTGEKCAPHLIRDTVHLGACPPMTVLRQVCARAGTARICGFIAKKTACFRVTRQQTVL